MLLRESILTMTICSMYLTLEIERTNSPKHRVDRSDKDESRVADLMIRLVHGSLSVDTKRGWNKECAFSL